MNNSKLLFLLLIYWAVVLLPANFVPVFETTEARYSEISWEMIYHNDFIEPRYNGVKHFHKPPLTYWLNAIGIKLFGANGFGVRFFGSLATVLTLLFTVKMAKLLKLGVSEQENTLYILMSSILFIAVSRIVSTDIYLTFFTSSSLYFLFRQIFYKKSSVNAYLFGLFLGLGFLTKGPIIFLFTLLPYFLNKIFSKEHRKNFSVRDIAGGFLVFLVVALPWYILVIIKNPELLNYFIKVQTVDRVVTNRFHRYQPFYFFILIFAGTFFPYIIPFFKSIFDDIKSGFKKFWLLLYIIVPFIIFSIAQSKLATYIAPLFPLAAIVSSENAELIFKNKFFKRFILLIMGLLSFVFLILPFLYRNLFNYWYFPVLFFVLSGISFWVLYKRQNLMTLSFYIIFLMLSGYFITPFIGRYINGYSEMADYANKLDPERKMTFVSYHADIPSMSFYRRKMSVIALGRKRETEFEKTEDYKKYYIDDSEKFSTTISSEDRFLITMSPKYLKNIAGLGFSCEEKFSQRKYSLFLCVKS